MAQKTAQKRDGKGRFLPGGPGGPGRGNTKAPPIAERVDGFQSAITGFGMSMVDKRETATYITAPLTDAVAADLWETNPLAARIVETWPSEMLREGFDVVIADDKDSDKERARETSERVEKRYQELEITETLWRLLAYNRAYGGSAGLLGALDASEMTSPLRLSSVRSFNYITTFEPKELYPIAWYSNPRHPKFGQPALFRISAYVPGPGVDGRSVPVMMDVHESRLLLFSGIQVTRQARTRTFWGGSVLTRVYRILRDHDMGFDAAAVLMQDFAQAVYSIKGLAEASIQDHDDAIKARLRAVELARSTIRGVVIDSEEEFKREQTPITGLPELLDRFITELAAAADMPQTLLMGQPPGGLNATGESDIRFFYDRVKAAQDRILRPVLERIVRLIFVDLGIPEPKKWSIEFRPLWQQSAKEIAEARKLQAETDAIYMEHMVASPEDICESRFGGDGYSFDTSIDFKARAAMEEEAKDLERRAQEQSILSAQAAANKPPDDRGDAVAEIVARYAG